MGRTSKLLRDLQRPDAPGAVEERIAYRKYGEQAHLEMLQRFGGITGENAGEALAWQASRHQELIRQGSKPRQ